MKNIGRTHRTERSGVALLMVWMHEIIERNNLDLGLPDVETGGTDRKMPDLVIYESRKSKQVLCLIEAKPPYFDVFDEEELKEPARTKANKRHAKYFALTNFRKLIWFDTERANKPISEEQQIINKYELSSINDLDQLDETRFKNEIVRKLEEFLKKLYAVHTGKESEPRIAIDEFLITRIQEKVNLLAYYYRFIIEEKFQTDGDFAAKLRNWFHVQMWHFEAMPDDFEKAARQTAYLLINKILFYDLLQNKRPNDLDPLEIPDGMTHGKALHRHLQGYFTDALAIDYESVFNTDFVDELAFPDSKEVTEEIKRLVALLSRYNFATLGFDVVGAIFERLIPPEERHILGQYFTSADVVDLILSFCLQHETDIVLDPSCGAGTFLVRTYQKKRLFNPRLEHEKILDTVWGNDIAKFPAHLSIINLAVNDLGVDENYPNVIQEDFFAIQVGKDGADLEAWRERMAKTLRGKEREVVYPKYFDAIVGNPPYTRQEEIEDIKTDDDEYKENLIESALKFGGETLATISKRAGIHAYFFVHGTKFLKEGGKFGFIVSNSWLDTNYGRGLQEFFLKHYKVVAIIESKVERWFSEADINTCIVILEKCSDEKARNANLVRFVYLKKKLRDFIPPTSQIWEDSLERRNQIDALRKTILAHDEIYENDEMRIFPRSQKELWTEGFDEEKQSYIGAKWGKYLRAPDIFFRMLQKCKDKLAFLRELADVETYLNTGGADGFFIVRSEGKVGKNLIKIRNVSKEGAKKKFEIEQNYVVKFIKSPRELQKIEVEEGDAQWLLVLPPIEKEKLIGKLIQKYIDWGEEARFNERSGSLNREPWWSLPKQATNPGEILWNRIHDDSHIVYYNPKRVSNTNFYAVWAKKVPAKVLVTVLNSTFLALIKEISGRTNFGLGALKTEGSDLRNFFVVRANLLNARKEDIEKVFAEISKREIGTIFEELGATSPEEVAFGKVRQDRLELDKIILQDILGLNEVEHLEIYRAVVDLARARLSRAKSVQKRSKKKGGSVGDAMTENLSNDLVNGD